MSIFSRIFDVFSQRPEAHVGVQHSVPESTRTRVLLWCGEVFSNSRSSYGSGDYTTQFWEQIHRFLQYRHGKAKLTTERQIAARQEDAMWFLMNCDGAEFLDFLEYIFSVECFFHVGLPEDQLVEELNDLLRQDNLPYYVTNFVKETVREVIAGYPYFGKEGDIIKTLEYPKVIMRETEVIHQQVIEPVLALLQKPHFRGANAEYLAALEDYRKGEFGDCLTKCASAFESVLKVVCDRKGWSYNQNDTAGSLIKIILSNTSLDSYFESPLLIIATLRNRLSTAHGAGTSARQAPCHLVRYALNTTASAMLLLADETGES